MDKETVAQPLPAVDVPQCPKGNEFDPFSGAKPCSPFYLYNHDSPRPSTDYRPKASFNVSLQDLESGSAQLTPSTTQEKLATAPTNQSVWRGMVASRCQSMTKPKEKNWLQRLPKRQRLIAKLLIALLVIGCMVGIAVGIAVGLKSTVWKGNNQQGNIA